MFSRFSVLQCDPEYEKNAANRKLQKPRPAPVRNTFWGRNAYSESESSSESEDSDDSSSDDSSDDNIGRVRRRKPNLAWQKAKKPSMHINRTPPRLPNSANAAKERSRLGRYGMVDLRNKVGDKNSKNYSTDAAAMATSRSDRGVNRVSTPVTVDRKKSSTPSPSTTGLKMLPGNRSTPSPNSNRLRNGSGGRNKNTDTKIRHSEIKRSASDKNVLSKTNFNQLPAKPRPPRPSSEKSVRSMPNKSDNKSEVQSNGITNGVTNGASETEFKENTNNNSEHTHRKPPRPPKKLPSPMIKELRALNTRPYGFGKKKLLGRPTVAANGIGVKKAPPSLRGRPDSPVDLPKISYRHKLQPSYDARIFAIRVPDTSSSGDNDDSSDESR